MPSPEPTLDLSGAGMIAFVRQRVLYTINANGTDEKSLTRYSEIIGDPSWGFRGEQIFYYSNPMSDTINVPELDGSGFGKNTIPLHDLAVSPDGRAIAFSARLTPNPTFDLHILYTDSLGMG